MATGSNGEDVRDIMYAVSLEVILHIIIKKWLTNVRCTCNRPDFAWFVLVVVWIIVDWDVHVQSTVCYLWNWYETAW